MRDDPTAVLLEPGATQEELLRAVEEVPVGRLIYHGPLRVRQISPEVSDLTAVLRFERRHISALIKILSSMDVRVRGLFWLHQEPESFVRVHTDCVYHPYQDYVRCIAALAPFLADADFFLCLRYEDDDGDWTYLVDRYRITDGKLRWLRSRTPDDDLDTYLASAR
ncbi:hypothetical protein ACFSKW_35195 [Nonomuraea mangrovi]|uniref:Uncharacterized protein n=1 Tax=Nonomuraea mangrovi TaxID=2316207 RepID=A0ABW4T441_9ACTN